MSRVEEEKKSGANLTDLNLEKGRKIFIISIVTAQNYIFFFLLFHDMT